MMAGTTFIALYRGNSVADARLIAVSAERGVVTEVVRRLLATPDPEDEQSDPVVGALDGGRRGALRLIAREGEAVAR